MKYTQPPATTPPTLLTPPAHGPVDQCCLCGKPSAAYWSGDTGSIGICQHCAADCLAPLAVDAAWLPADYGHDDLLDLHRRIESRVWRALTERLLRERPKGQDGQS
jgi:hypothetical protein